MAGQRLDCAAMTHPTRALLFLVILSLAGALRAEIPTDFQQAFDERCRAVVAVEFFVQNEIDRQPSQAMGLVIDNDGHIILLEGSVPNWLPPERFKNFKIKHPGDDGEGWDATYLGQNDLSGWHYLQASEEARAELTNVFDFGHAEVKVGEFVWGIATMGENWAFTPYFLSGRVSAQKPLPWLVAFSDRPTGTPGSAMFNASGQFVGWAGPPTTDDKVIYMNNRRFMAAIQYVRESNSFMTAAEVMKYAPSIPTSPVGAKRPWLGVSGLQALDREVAEIMGLTDQGALTVSDIIEESPAAKAGLKSRDIIVGVGGEKLPKLTPDMITVAWFEKEILKQKIGAEMTLDVISGNEGKQVTVQLGEQPLSLREAEREYFDRLGLSARQFTLADALSKRELKSDIDGAVVSFVKPNSPVQSAELEPGDWIKEIDGQAVNSYADAIAALQKIEADQSREEFVLLVERDNETKVLRAKLK